MESFDNNLSGSLQLQHYSSFGLRTEMNKIIILIATELTKKLLKKRKKIKRRIWVRSWISRRDSLGASSRLLTEMRDEDINGYRNFLRMLPQKFDELLSKIASAIQKESTHMREAIAARVKLEITLRYLATGDSLQTLSALYRVGRSTICQFIPEVCSAICMALKEYIQVSKTVLWYFIISFRFSLISQTEKSLESTNSKLEAAVILSQIERRRLSHAWNILRVGDTYKISFLFTFILYFINSVLIVYLGLKNKLAINITGGMYVLGKNPRIS